MSRNPPIPQSTSLFKHILPLILPLLPSAMSQNVAPSDLPQVDFSRMGTVGLGGSFQGLDWYTTNNPFGASSSSATFSTNGDTLLYRSSDGILRPLGSTNSGGQINAICWLPIGGNNGTVFIGGSFSSLGGANVANVASYAISGGSFGALSNGLDAPVEALYCDEGNGQVWIGGSFQSPNQQGPNVALWATSSSSWQSVPFGGFNGPVSDISNSTNGSSIYFSGSFTTLFSSNSSINTSQNVTSIQSAPSNTSTTGHSGFLTPVNLPPLSSASGQLTITAGPSTSQSQYSNPNVVLCPGSGVWLAQDNTISDIDVMGYNYFRALGARIRNANIEGRGATEFCFTSLPDNTQLNMTYTDPVTGQNATCWEHCPLSTDPTIAAQDFIFTDGARNLTGLQMQLKTWIGQGAGLSSVELLSDGAFGWAAETANQQSCPSINSSSVQTTGSWQTDTVSTNVPATTAYYIQTEVPTNNVTYPSVTFYPYVSAAGYYDVYVLIPGCQQTQDCSSRTDVDIEVFPQNGGLGWTSTISEQVSSETSTLVYSGPMDATTADFTPTVILALAQNPTSVNSDHYSIVAQAVQLTFISTSAQGSGGSTVPGVSSSSSRNSTYATAFGVFEYPTSATFNVSAVNGPLSNSTETALTKLGFALDAAHNASSASSNWTVNAVVEYQGTVFVAGSFSAGSNYSNVVSVNSAGQVTPLAAQGLSGQVLSTVAIGYYIYFGGQFTNTASGGTVLQYLARYDPSGNAWAAVQGGVDGPVLDLATDGSSLFVFGNFSHTVSSTGTTTQTGGYAVYDTSSSSWSDSGVVFGTASAGSVFSNNVFLGGKVVGASSNAVEGFAFLTTGSSGAEISSLQGVDFESAGSGSSISSQSKSYHSPTSKSRRWLSDLTSSFHARALALTGRATAPTIPTLPVTAPAVLAGAFYTNGSTQVTVLGGNFSTDSGIGALGFYANNALSGPTPSVSGVVRALAVMGHTLYAGGSGLNVTGVGSGLLAYTLSNGEWLPGSIPTLNAQSGLPLTVNVIRQRGTTNTLVVAGTFGTAGSLGCAGVCLWDTEGGQWSAPSSGLSSGEVRSVDFAGDSSELMLVAGSFVLSSGETAYAASYSFTNNTWTALGSLPGPALAIASDNKNSTNIFAAGYGSDGSPYLSQWNGETWTAQNNSLQAGSIVSSLAFVPMQTAHTAEGTIEGDRMLLVSGDLYLQGTGNVTSALFDGARWYPYLVGTSSSGSLGAASSLFWSESDFSFTIANYLARGLVVLIAIAIATGLILLIILLFFLIAYCLRRTERRRPVETETFNKDPSGASVVSSTHQNVFNNVQAALEATLLGAGAGGAIAAARGSMDSEYHDNSDGGEPSSEEGDDEGRETTMRYDFEGAELQPGEMAMKAGQKIIILDDVQSDEWWYARDPASGREGVVPATYVW